MTARVALYGRTYLDAEVSVPLASLATGKGKVDVEVATVYGGFACNAARALVGRLPKRSLRVVTLSSWLDWPRLRAALPDEVELDPIITASIDPPPVSVILNPAAECRLLRAPADHDAKEWTVDRVAAGALAARLHVLGRLPPPFVAELLACVHATGGRVAWVGGAALPRDLESACDLICVNTAEAHALLGSTSESPRELASALANRAAPGAVRLVTGRGSAPAAAAIGGGEVHEHAPAEIPKPKIKRLKGVGDVFAAHFVVEAVFDRRGGTRARLDVAGALEIASKIAGDYIRSDLVGPHMGRRGKP